METDREDGIVREVTDWDMILAQHKLRINEFLPLRAAAANRVCVRWRSVVDTLTLSTQQQKRLLQAISKNPQNTAMLAYLSQHSNSWVDGASADLSQFAGVVTDEALIALTKGSPGLTSLNCGNNK